MARIFAYILHKDGVADDLATEMITAAKKIDQAASPTAILTGCGPELDKACESLRNTYSEIWKVAKEQLGYPNAELVRQALVSILPPGCILLLAHDHFGLDLSPGLSIKMNSAFVPDVVSIEGMEGAYLRLVRQEFGGQVSTHVRCDVSAGAVLNVRPGAFKPQESAPASGVVV